VVEAVPVEAEKAFNPDEILLWYQRDYLGWCQSKDVVIVEKSRRIGITWADASDSVMLAAAEKSADGMDCFYIGYNKDMASEYIDAVGWWARKLQKAADSIREEIIKDGDTDITVFSVKFASGFQVAALSSRPSNLRGRQGKVIIDEAAHHPDLPGLIKASMALLIWGGRVSIISTHEGDDNPFYGLIQDAEKYGYKRLCVTFREAVAQGLYRRFCQVNSREWTQEAEEAWVEAMYTRYGDGAREELDVIPSSGTGSWLTRALIEKRQVAGIPVVRYEQSADFALLDEGTRVSTIEAFCEDHLLAVLDVLNPLMASFFGMDFARSGDLSALWILQETPDGRFTTPLLIELRGIPFEQQKQILFYVIDRLPRFSFGKLDARGNGQYLAEVAQQHYGAERVEQVMLSESWYRENAPRMKAFIEDGDLDLPKDADVTTDLRMVKLKNGIAKVPAEAKSKGADGKPRHGDTAIACMLAVSATKEDIVEYAYYPGNDDKDDDSVNWRRAAL